MSLRETFISTVESNKLINKHDSILVALSGGADSACLLHFIMSIKERYILSNIALAYINYTLRTKEETDKEETFVKSLSLKYKLPLFSKRVKIKEKTNLQERARRIRFAFFKTIIEKEHYTKLAIGHNLDDLIENFVLRLSRGSGLRGLVSFSYSNNLDNMSIIRPLLDIEKKQITKYMKRHNYPYIIDSSNQKAHYKRNALRLNVLSNLEKAFPSYKNALLKSISDLKTSHLYCDLYIASIVKKLITKTEDDLVSLDLDKLKALDGNLKAKLIARASSMIEPQSFTKKSLSEIIRKIDNFNNKGSMLAFKRGNFYIGLEYNLISFYFVYDNKLERSDISSSILSYNTHYRAFSNYFLLCDKIRLTKKRVAVFIKALSYGADFVLLFGVELSDLSIRFVKKGDRVYFNSRVGEKKIKEILINKKIPKRERGKVMLLLHKEKPIGTISHIAGLNRIADKYHINSKTSFGVRISIKQKKS